MGRGLAEGKQDAAADRVSERAAEPGQHLNIGSECQHITDSTGNPEFRKSWIVGSRGPGVLFPGWGGGPGKA
ncbi:hypothetical protein GCM10009579_16730 [Streptomyces javensis]|uniref:Uncharacterized protein n=1 Tax=Streptomyces javensis TaxID=114698 RepID=A0ABN1WQG0_9ACTN